MQKLERLDGLSTSKYTEIYHDEPEFGAPHLFQVFNVKTDPNDPLMIVTEVQFQKGPIKEFGVNGCANEDLINMVLIRLTGFQNTPYACEENAEAIKKLEEALMWLRKRTTARESRQVEGTHLV